MTKKKSLQKRDIEFLYEIGSIRFVQRTWKRFLNMDVEGLAEHHFRVVWIALLIAKHEGVSNTDKLMKMAIVHDIAESRTGDTDYLSRQYVTQNEELAISDILGDTILEKEFVELAEEYEKKDCIEAKIVKDADYLSVDFEVAEQAARGNKIGEGWKKPREYVYQEKLYTSTAREIWQVLQTTNPHDWHYKGRNRYNGGDWKKKK